jgi:hypothetical protein
MREISFHRQKTQPVIRLGYDHSRLFSTAYSGLFFSHPWLAGGEEMKTPVFKNKWKLLLDATHHLPLGPDIPDP